MSDGYVTAFEVSYFSNNELLFSLALLGGALILFVVGVKGLGRPLNEAGRAPSGVWKGWLIWQTISICMVVCAIHEGRSYTRALRSGRTKVAEGIVSVLHRQPAGGHAAGDRIRIGDQEFEYSYFTFTLAYNRTISHDGVLTEGTRARVHYLEGEILKVEVR